MLRALIDVCGRYLTVDWERRNFSISQCVFNDDVLTNKQQLVAIIPTDAVKVPNLSPSAVAKSSSPSAGEIAGIVIGVIVVLALLLGGFVRYKRKQRRQRRQHEKNRSEAASSTPDSSPPQQGFVMLNQNQHSKPELGTGPGYERYELSSTTKSPSASWLRNEKPSDFEGGRQVIGVKDNTPSMPELASPPPILYQPVHEMESPTLRPADPAELHAEEAPKQLYGSEPDLALTSENNDTFVSDPTVPSPPYRSATQSPIPRSSVPSPLSQPSESPPTMHSVATRPGLHSRTSTMASLPGVALPSVFSPHRSGSVSSPRNRVSEFSNPPVSPTVMAGAVEETGLGISSVMGGSEQVVGAGAGPGEASGAGLEAGTGAAGKGTAGAGGETHAQQEGGMI